MANVTCFTVSGVRLWFYSNDHEPPHFHAKRQGEWEYRVRFLEGPKTMFEFVWSEKKKQMSRADRQRLRKLVVEHRIELLCEWEQKVATQ